MSLFLQHWHYTEQPLEGFTIDSMNAGDRCRSRLPHKRQLNQIEYIGERNRITLEMQILDNWRKSKNNFNEL